MTNMIVSKYLNNLFQYIYYLTYQFSRPFIKWFLHRTTGLCELQRIVYGTTLGYDRTVQVEKSIKLSRSKVLRKIDGELSKTASMGRLITDDGRLKIELALEAICYDKKIKPEIHHRFVPSLRVSVVQIYAYRNLLFEIESLRAISYDSENDDHERRLSELWRNLVPDQELKKRIGKHWTQIGFQGEDPATDFRGMGLLGLENLLYFSSRYGDEARKVLLHSQHPKFGYPFACVGINLTSLAYKMTMDGRLKKHFYNACPDFIYIKDFHKAYCAIFQWFDKFWMDSKPRDIMEFRHYFEKFIESLVEKLEKEPDFILKLSAIETL